jgi:hypothetical protein
VERSKDWKLWKQLRGPTLLVGAAGLVAAAGAAAAGAAGGGAGQERDRGIPLSSILFQDS